MTMRPVHDLNDDDPLVMPGQPHKPPPPKPEWRQVPNAPEGVQRNSRTGRFRNVPPGEGARDEP